MCLKGFLVLWACVSVCQGVIYELNDTEYARMPPLYGLDDYHNCLLQPDGMYCMAFFNLYDNKPNELMQVIQDYSAYDVKHYNHSYIQRGICVTKTCYKYMYGKEKDTNVILAECLNDSITLEYGVHARFAAMAYCDKPTENYDIQIIDLLVAGVFIIILMLNVIGSLRHITKQPHRDSEVNVLFWEQFAIQRNWKNLINSEVNNDHFVSFYGIRSIFMFLIIFGHTMWLIEFGYNDNTHDFEKGYDTITYMMVFNGMQLVQIFFVMSGFLMMYRCLKFSEDAVITWKMYPLLVLLRWLRLTPASAASLAFSATWLRFLGSGPLWPLYIRDGVVADCRRYWWLHLLYLNNYVPDDKYCELHTWYLAADFQLYMLGLAVFVSTPARARVRVLLGLLGAGMLAAAAQVWARGLDALLLLTPEFHRTFSSEEYHFLHVLGHINIPSYAIGMAAGLIAYNALRSAKRPAPGRWARVAAGVVYPLGAAVVYSGRAWYGGAGAAGAAGGAALRAAFAATHRAAFGAAAAAGMLAAVLHWKLPLARVLSWRGWTVTSRLTYCTYLVHVNVILLLFASRTQLGHVHMFHLLINHLGVVAMSLLLALPLHLLVEAPFKSLMINCILGSRTKNKKQ